MAKKKIKEPKIHMVKTELDLSGHEDRIKITYDDGSVKYYNL